MLFEIIVIRSFSNEMKERRGNASSSFALLKTDSWNDAVQQVFNCIDDLLQLGFL
jgi:hypothetical protein